MTVDENMAAATSEYKGKTYYFCSVSCKENFEKELEKHVREVQ
jgi:Cu+-exporting ATPase